MKIDTFINLINDIRKGQLTDDTDPNNTVIQMYNSPFDTINSDEAIRTMKVSPSSIVWGDGRTYTATDSNGASWQAPSCGWIWGTGGKWN